MTEGTREGCRRNSLDSSLIFFLPRFATLLMLALAQTQYNSGVSSLKKKRAAAISLCSKEEDLKAKSTSSITGKHKGCTRDPSWSWGGCSSISVLSFELHSQLIWIICGDGSSSLFNIFTWKLKQMSKNYLALRR